MESSILFSEKQRFKQIWLWTIILAINGLFIFGVVKQVFFRQPFGDKPMNNVWLWASLGISGMLTLLFVFISLETQIKSDGIYVKFFPIHRTFRKFAWDDLKEVYARTYSPIFEFGGWGYRIMLGSGKAYNISGNKGIQLVFNNNSKLLIGTQKSDEVEKILTEINHKQNKA